MPLHLKYDKISDHIDCSGSKSFSGIRIIPTPVQLIMNVKAKRSRYWQSCFSRSKSDLFARKPCPNLSLVQQNPTTARPIFLHLLCWLAFCSSPSKTFSASSCIHVTCRALALSSLSEARWKYHPRDQA